jgi:sporulation protein YlmC with PRC-barrel domain
MKCEKYIGPIAAIMCLSLATSAGAADPVATGTASPVSIGEKPPIAVTTKPDELCLKDLREFHGQMQTDGYWLAGSGDAYGYPIGASGYAYGYSLGSYPAAFAHYPNVRPGYEIRMLLLAANILARRGEHQTCEAVLSTTKTVYTAYTSALHEGGARRIGEPAWRLEEIAAAQPVTNNDNSFRSDQLLGTEVRSGQNDPLGSVDDLVMNPQTGKIAYLVIGRGGIFGIGEKFVPVPWEDFKVSPKAKLLVLQTTKGVMDAAPRVARDQSMTTDQFNQESPKVDAYWKTHLSDKTSN